MKLLLKFNLVFLVVFVAGLLGLGATGVMTRELLERNAQEEVLQHARFMLEKALAVRSYTSTQVAPLLETQMKYGFLPQSVPAFAATEVLAKVQKNHPEFSYKEATLNPTNPRDRAVEWEADVIASSASSPTRRSSSASATRRPAARSTSRGRSASPTAPACAATAPSRHRAALAGRQVRPGQRLRLAARRGDRRSGRLGADGAAAGARPARPGASS
jgi:hypothetical protein